MCLTTAAAATLLTALGTTARNGGPVRPKTVIRWCQRGLFIGAWHSLNQHRGAWHIPRESVESFAKTVRIQGKKRGEQ